MARDRTISMPGAVAGDEAATAAASAAAPEALTVEQLQALLAAKDAQIATQAAALAAAQSAQPAGLIVPVTPHGQAALAASGFAHLRVHELMAKIDAGEVKEPITGILCADGWYAGRASR